MSSGDTPTGPGASSPLQQLRLPRFREASGQAPFEQIPIPSISQQGSLIQPQPDNPSQFQRPSHGVNLSPLFRPYQAGTRTQHARRSANSRPRRARCYGTMRALSMTGVYPSSLVYLGYQKLAKDSRTVGLEFQNYNTTTILASAFVPQTRPKQRTCRTKVSVRHLGHADATLVKMTVSTGL
jgi:hypothetical protein